MRTKPTSHTIARARRLRLHATEYEKRLWWKLRELKKLGYHFRRQVPFRSYFLDFVEHGARMVIELDGAQHGQAEHRERDAVRDAILKGEGYRVLRYWNAEIAENIDGVVEAVVRTLSERPPTRTATPS